MNKGTVKLIVVILPMVLLIPCLCEDSGIDLGKDLQRDLRQSKTAIEQINDKLKTGGLITNELTS